MTLYNLTNLTATTGTSNIGNFVCQINYISNFWWATIVLFMLFIIALILLMRYDYTIYTSLPIACMLAAMVATLFRFWQCNDVGMIPTTLVIIFWTLTGLFTAIRVAIKN